MPVLTEPAAEPVVASAPMPAPDAIAPVAAATPIAPAATPIAPAAPIVPGADGRPAANGASKGRRRPRNKRRTGRRLFQFDRGLGVRWIAGADCAGSLARSENGASPTKIVPELGALVKVAPEKPTRFTACTTPGTCIASSETRRFTASVRSSAAPPGNCITATRYPWSVCGMKPAGVLLNSRRPKASTPA